ncbi:hypothetical protein AB0I53_32585 [Saccharopolyspora sp. NPDC050389]|uniref:hypothetical protein n=1 Tax=Saccharopolyspora sp. NPDC050389 TaxID=3155516 RepID=UPI0033D154D8
MRVPTLNNNPLPGLPACPPPQVAEPERDRERRGCTDAAAAPVAGELRRTTVKQSGGARCPAIQQSGIPAPARSGYPADSIPFGT